ncbi:MAG: PEP-CTERM sorting domain-containing protein [Planctomycetota bacterium]
MSKCLLVCGVAVASVAGLATNAHAGSIFVENHSFEATELPDGDHTRVAPPGWTTLDGRFGTFNPTAVTYPLGVPDGVNTTHSNGGTMSQVLAAVLEPNTIYTIHVELGNRPETPFPGYMVQLLAAGSLLAEDVSSVAPPSETFATSQVTYTATIADAHLGGALEIRLVSFGIQTNFDDVRVTATVIPAPGMLALLGVAGLAGCSRRRRR